MGTFKTGHTSDGQGFSLSNSQLPLPDVSPQPKLPRKGVLQPPKAQTKQRLVITDPATGNASVIVEFGKDKAAVWVSEGNSWSFADNLTPEEAGKLVAGIAKGTFDLEKLPKEEGVEGVLTRFFNSVSEASKETAFSVISGIVGESLVTLLGPVGAIVIPLGVGAAAKLLTDKKSHE